MVDRIQNCMENTVGSRQDNMIVGTLLGDGFLERNGLYVRLVADHSVKQAEYVCWKAKILEALRPVVINKE